MPSPISDYRRRTTQVGQTIYVVLLVIAAVFLCIAIAFPAYEFISRRYWEKPPKSRATSMVHPPSEPTPGPDGATGA